MTEQERLEVIKRQWHEEDTLDFDAYEWLIEQAERVEKTVKRNKELEYASVHNGDLNSFLQKRKLPANTLGRHVVDVVMDYVQELEQIIENQDKIIDRKEQQNKHYREALEFYADVENYTEYENRKLGLIIDVVEDGGEEARKALESESK